MHLDIVVNIRLTTLCYKFINTLLHIHVDVRIINNIFHDYDVRYSAGKVCDRDIEFGVQKSNSRVPRPDTFVEFLSHRFLIVFCLITETMIELPLV